MKALILLLSLLASGQASAAAYQCGCTPLEKGAPGFFDARNWLVASGSSPAAIKARITPKCYAKFGRRELNIGCSSQAQINAVSRARQARAAVRRQPRRESWRGTEAEEREQQRRGEAFLEETKRRNREDQINQVLEDARRRGVILPGGYP